MIIAERATGGLRIWDFLGGEKCCYDLQYPGVGVIKKGVQLPEIIKKNTCGNFRGSLFVGKFQRALIFPHFLVLI